MTTEAIRSDFINFLVEEHSKEKQKSNINNNTKEYNDVETNNKNVSTNLISIIILKLIILTVFIIKKLSLFLYLYFKNLKVFYS